MLNVGVWYFLKLKNIQKSGHSLTRNVLPELKYSGFQYKKLPAFYQKTLNVYGKKAGSF